VISAFLAVTNPRSRGDLFDQCLESALGVADEVVIVDGGTTDGSLDNLDPRVKVVVSLWPKEFDWPLIGQQFQKGYEACSGKWVLHLDLDFIFHEYDYGAVRWALAENADAPAVSFYKHQFISPDRYNLKSRLVLAVNKTLGQRIKFNGSGDLCQPTLDGKDLDLDSIPEAGVPFYNYEHILKTGEQVAEDVGRMDRAYKRHFGKALYSADHTAMMGWLIMMEGRLKKPSKQIPLEKHPKVMQEVIKSLTPEQFGYDCFGLKERVYA
jgi:hypothetical protein